MASVMIFALSRSSEYSFSSCLLPASSSLSGAIMEPSIPPYLARHLEKVAVLTAQFRHRCVSLNLPQNHHDLAVALSGFTHRISFIENFTSKNDEFLLGLPSWIHVKSWVDTYFYKGYLKRLAGSVLLQAICKSKSIIHFILLKNI